MKAILVADDDRTTRTMLAGVLKAAGYAVSTAADGKAALAQMRKKKFDLVLTDIWMPKLNGIELLSQLREDSSHPRVMVMTSDETSATLLKAIREQAYQYITKPFDPKILVELIADALSAHPISPPIEVLSALPYWVELLVPCQLDVTERIQSFLQRLKADLPEEVRRAVGQAFRELLNNAIEWGGKLDPNQKVRISYLRAKRMLMYRISDPGPGFKPSELKHAAMGNPSDEPFAHDAVRIAKGIRPGGYGLLMTQSLVDELLYNEAQNEVVLIKYLDTPAPTEE